MSDAFVRPDVAEGTLWLETPQTEAASRALFTLLDLARSDDPGWQPFWVLCGPEGSGKTALAARFAAQAQRASTCDAVRAAEARYVAEMRDPKLPSPATFERRDRAWAAYRAFEAMSPAERVARFGHCPHVCRPAEFLPGEEFRAAIKRARASKPVGLDALGATRRGGVQDALAGAVWNSPGNKEGDPARRTALFLLDGADHLTRLTSRKRGDFLAELKEWPRQQGVEHPVIFVMIGRPQLVGALVEFGAVRTIELPGMTHESSGTFAEVCRLVFGTRDGAEIERLHRASGGLMGPLLMLARMHGLKPPFNINEGEILGLPASKEG